MRERRAEEAAAALVRREAWSAGRPVGEVGEFALIERLERWVTAATATAAAGPSAAGAAPVARVTLAMGDDAALLDPPADSEIVLTCDVQAEGRHFHPAWLTPHELGRRAIEINLSDLAAMGARPAAALISLGLPRDLGLDTVEQLYAGMLAALGGHGARIAGGNVSGADKLWIDITLIGTVERGRALRRSGARVGDLVMVTGAPGRAAAAEALLTAVEAPRDAAPGEPHEPSLAACLAELRAAYAAPEARVAAGRHLLERDAATAAIDVSDGLAADLGHLAAASGVALRLEEALLPVDAALAGSAAALERDPLDWILGASDDYELAFTVPRARASRALAMRQTLELPVTLIGHVVAGEPGVHLHRRTGKTIALSGGWDHLRPGPPA